MPVSIKPPDPPEDLEYLDNSLDYMHALLAGVYIDQDNFNLGQRWLLKAIQYLENSEEDTHPQLAELIIKAKSLTDPANMEYWGKLIDQWRGIAQDNEGTDLEYDALGILGMLFCAYGNCLLKNGMWEIAYWFYYQAYTGQYKLLYSPYDQQCLEILRRMVACLVEGDRCDEGVKLARKCVRRAKKAYGEWHKETVLALEKLGEALFFQAFEGTEESLKVLEDAMVKAKSVLGPCHSTTSMIRNTLEMQKRLLPDSNSLSSPELNDQIFVKPFDIALVHLWEVHKADLEHFREKYGPYHIITRRYRRFVGEKPAETMEEYVDRVRRCFGPHKSYTKQCEQQLDYLKRFAKQQPMEDGNSAKISELKTEPPNCASRAKGKQISEEKQNNNLRGEEETALTLDDSDTEFWVEPPEPEIGVDIPDEQFRDIWHRSRSLSRSHHLKNSPNYYIGLS